MLGALRLWDELLEDFGRPAEQLSAHNSGICPRLFIRQSRASMSLLPQAIQPVMAHRLHQQQVPAGESLQPFHVPQ